MEPKPCVVCLCDPRSVRFGCGHAVLCESCLPVVRDCPLCRVPIVVIARGENIAIQNTFLLTS